MYTVTEKASLNKPRCIIILFRFLRGCPAA
jgi:hypothetical protein